MELRFRLEARLTSWSRLWVLPLVVGFVMAPWMVAAEPRRECPDFVTKYAPVLWLHSEDPYKPSDLLAHVQHTTPMLDGKPIPDLPSLNLDNLEILNRFGSKVALTSREDPSSNPPDWIMGEEPDADGRLHDATACVVILVERSKLDLDAFYFYFYSYDQGPNVTQVLEPLNRLVEGSKAEKMHFGNHVGDWEHNMVRFRGGQPTGIYYSQHRDGRAYSWYDSTVSKTDGRPIVYSARGSHANYPTQGDQLHDIAILDYCDAGRKWDPILSAYFYRLDPETFSITRLSPPRNLSSASPPLSSSSSSNMTSFFYYEGHWGDLQYPDSDPRQATVPYFGIKRFLSGPNGPRFKHLVRRGLMPDERRRVAWLEWSVSVYMALYPCCLKGWRAWVSGTLVAFFLVGVVVGITIGVGRFRRRKTAKYTKLHEEEILLDDWRMEDDALLSSSEDESRKNI